MSDDFDTGRPEKVPTLPCTISLAPREIDTLIAALTLWRTWSSMQINLPEVLSDRILDIATESGPRLGDFEVDTLIDRLNAGS